MKMSDQTEVFDNHLCATVDAFENIQAISMFEEEQYISLSDILPKQKIGPKKCTDEVVDAFNTTKFSPKDTYTNFKDDQNSITEKTVEDVNKLEQQNDRCYKPSSDDIVETIQNIQKFIENTTVDNLTKTSDKKPRKSIYGAKKKSATKARPEATCKSSQKPNISRSNNIVSQLKRRGRKKKQVLKKELVGNEDLINNTDTQPSKQKTIFNETGNNTDDKNKLNDPDELPKRTKTKRVYLKKRPCGTFDQQQESDNKTITDNNNANDQKNSDDDDICLIKLSKNQMNKNELDAPRKHLLENKIINADFEKKEHNTENLLEVNAPEDQKVYKSQINDLNNGITENKKASVVSKNDSNNSEQVKFDVETNLDKLQETKENLDGNETRKSQSPLKRYSKTTVMSDFEYNIDNIVTENICHDKTNPCNIDLNDDGSKRPVRRKTKTSLHYNDGSDEDPFANMELSEDDEFKTKKSGKYYSDDEYVPSGHKSKSLDTDSSDSGGNISTSEGRKSKKKRTLKQSHSLTPKKRGKKFNSENTLESNILEIDDIEENLATSCIKTNDQINTNSNIWGTTNEFENFLAKRIQGTNIKIKKVSIENAESTITPLQIPTIDQNEPKKTIDVESQTVIISTTSTGVQTNSRYHIPIKENIALTPVQSEKACEFLKNCFKTTAELGQLMTQKSEDFVAKKINVAQVKDTSKVDYCVKKSFLLLELAKDNLMKMEEDLEQQYEQYLFENNLTHCREKPLKLAPTVINSDSDCEIVEESVAPMKPPIKSNVKPKFNPKTVFLNKELSIKIAKKPKEDINLNIKGRHTVWINDSVMVKKVKPTQSFLAQDGRNKKPPDHTYVTLEMVSDFFKTYYHQKVLAVCAQFTSKDWLYLNKDSVCNYFVTQQKLNDSDNESGSEAQDFNLHTSKYLHNSSKSQLLKFEKTTIKGNQIYNPGTLFAVSAQALHYYMYGKNAEKIQSVGKVVVNKLFNPESLKNLCTEAIQNHMYYHIAYIRPSNNNMNKYHLLDETIKFHPASLFTLCSEAIKYHIYDKSADDVNLNNYNKHKLEEETLKFNPETLFTLCTQALKYHICDKSADDVNLNNYNKHKLKEEALKFNPETLFTLCTQTIKYHICDKSADDVNLNVYNKHKLVEETLKFNPETLFTLCTQAIKYHICDKSTDDVYLNNYNKYKLEEETLKFNPETLFKLCTQAIKYHICDKSTDDVTSSNYNEHKLEEETLKFNSETLFILSSESLNNIYHKNDCVTSSNNDYNNYKNEDEIFKYIPETLFTLCTQVLKYHIYEKSGDVISSSTTISKYQPEVELLIFNPEICQTLDKKADSQKDVNKTIKFDPETLFHLSLKVVHFIYFYVAAKYIIQNIVKSCDIPVSIKKKCEKINKEMFKNDGHCESKGYTKKFSSKSHFPEFLDVCCKTESEKNRIKSLFSLSVGVIQKMLCNDSTFCFTANTTYRSINTPKSLKYISYKKMLPFLSPVNSEMPNYLQSKKDDKIFTNLQEKEDTLNFLNINSINSLSEEAFSNMKTSCLEENSNSLEYYEDDDSSFDNGDSEYFVNDKDDDNLLSNTNWEAQIQMKELKSCINSASKISDNTSELKDLYPTIQIKTEPPEETIQNKLDLTIVKNEFTPGLNEMTLIPEHFVTKHEQLDSSQDKDEFILHSDNSSYDAAAFEAFLATQNYPENREVFSQSVLRVSGVHEPDFLSELDSIDSLLVPQTYKSVHIEKAKNALMESNSEDEMTDKKIEKKKIDKRKMKRKISKQDSKTISPAKKEIEKSKMNNEVVAITTRMQNKIKQKEKRLAPTDSEGEEDLNVTIKRNEEGKKNKMKSTIKPAENEIQCNNVDSTEQIIENLTDSNKNSSETVENTTNKLLSKDVDTNCKDKSEKMLNKVKKNEFENEPCSAVVNFDDPVELLECEPTLPIFDDYTNKSDDNSEIIVSSECTSDKQVIHKATYQDPSKTEYIERHGWKCYKIDSSDSKLWQNAQVVLDKLPETFVDRYLHYQDLMDQDEEDLEVERLTNLNSLNRPHRANKSCSKDNKIITKCEKPLCTPEIQKQNLNSDECADDCENYEELIPSEDEETLQSELAPPAVPTEIPENNMAKHLLMNDNDSDEGINVKNIKEELLFDVTETKKRCGPKSKTQAMVTNSGELMLTADRVLNQELTLMNAPVNLENDVITASKNKVFKKKQKISTKPSTREQTQLEKQEEHSSSEEEKQWSNTKEKLLKHIDKKENSSENDAKRAKLVNEFIEKHGYKRRRRKNTFRSRRLSKKHLEEQKQYSVLFKQLYGGELPPITNVDKNQEQGTNRRSRNSGKVTSKKQQKNNKDLSYSILVQESERTKRINARQSELRKLLGCSENETVQVIDGQVCLEYDFETGKPVVSVHASLTKHMKEHQYSGVKFMWDACFESLSLIKSSHPGSGCILAHCMGLGKTLQVLALIHTVLTHPEFNMKRVLVCCPLSTVLNWVDEIHKWMPVDSNPIKVFELSKLKKTFERAFQLEDWYKGGGIFIMGYELFRSLTTLEPTDVKQNVINKIQTALINPGPDIIVCDEGHLLKNDGSILTMAMSRVLTKRRIVLTGTPMQNNLKEYYCMVNFIKPNLLGTYSEFFKKFECPITAGQHKDSTEQDTKLMKSRTFILRKVLEGCLQRQEISVMYPYLPRKHEYTVFITLTKCQWDLYKHYMHNYAKKGNQSVLKDFHVLQKIWSHPQVFHNFQTSYNDKTKIKGEKSEEDIGQEEQGVDTKPSELWWPQYLDEGNMLETVASSNKFIAVFHILTECVLLKNKLLIFSTSLFTLDSLEYFLKKINNWKLGHEYFRLDGSVPPEVRQDWCRKFNAKNNEISKVFLISTRAGCLGLNLTGANRVIIMDTSWNPAHDIQSIFRVYRFGQERDCYIYRLVAMGTMEQKIYERSVTKQAVACRVVDEQLIDRHYNCAELTELYSFDESGSSVLGGVAVGVCDEVLLRVARDVPIHAIHEHDSLLRGTSEQDLPQHVLANDWRQFLLEQAEKRKNIVLALDKVRKQFKHRKDTVTSRSTPLKQEESTVSDTIETHKRNLRSSGFNEVLNKKSKLTESLTPVSGEIEEPETTGELLSSLKDLHLQNMIVKKISEILIEHQIQEEEVTDLVNKVLNRINNGNKAPVADANDELSKNIADVLMQKVALATPTVPTIMTTLISNSGDTTQTIQVQTGKKRKTETILEEPYILPDASNNSDNTINHFGRKKRKSAIAAEKFIKLNATEMCKENEIINLNSPTAATIPDQVDSDSPYSDIESSELVISKSIKDSKTDEERNDRRNLTRLNEDRMYDEIAKSSKIVYHQIKNCLDSNNKKRKNFIFDQSESNKADNNEQKSNVHNKPTKKLRTSMSLEVPLSIESSKTNKLSSNKACQDKNKGNTNNDDVIDLTDMNLDYQESETSINVENDAPSMNTVVERQAPAIDTVVKRQAPAIHTVIERQEPANVNGKSILLEEETSDDEEIPLTRSLLTNENFVRVIAHKYLRDNPSMTTESTLLAANYKIKQALEVYDSGKTICRGSIYDDAVEIVGKDTLKKLHLISKSGNAVQARKLENYASRLHNASKRKVSKEVTPAQDCTTISDDFIIIDDDLPLNTVKIPEQSVNTKISNINSAKHTPRSTMNSTDVFPVQLFKGPTSISRIQNLQWEKNGNLKPIDSDECIVPNLQNKRDTLLATSKNTVAADNSTRPLVGKKIPVSKAGESSKQITEVNKPSNTNKKPSRPNFIPSQRLTHLNETVIEEAVVISDDEEQPVPVALTVVNTPHGLKTLDVGKHSRIESQALLDKRSEKIRSLKINPEIIAKPINDNRQKLLIKSNSVVSLTNSSPLVSRVQQTPNMVMQPVSFELETSLVTNNDRKKPMIVRLKKSSNIENDEATSNAQQATPRTSKPQISSRNNYKLSPHVEEITSRKPPPKLALQTSVPQASTSHSLTVTSGPSKNTRPYIVQSPAAATFTKLKSTQQINTRHVSTSQASVFDVCKTSKPENNQVIRTTSILFKNLTTPNTNVTKTKNAVTAATGSAKKTELQLKRLFKVSESTKKLQGANKNKINLINVDTVDLTDEPSTSDGIVNNSMNKQKFIQKDKPPTKVTEAQKINDLLNKNIRIVKITSTSGDSTTSKKTSNCRTY